VPAAPQLQVRGIVTGDREPRASPGCGGQPAPCRRNTLSRAQFRERGTGHPKLAVPHRASVVLALALCIGACQRPPGEAAQPGAFQPSPSADEDYCAWYGSARDGVLYFGEAAFWSSYRRRGGDPRADLEREGPQPIGRFDLGGLSLLEPLDVTVPGARSGVWDVLAHPNGRVYFSTFFEHAGWIDPRSGRLERLPAAGLGLNELALGPGGAVVASRYGGPGDGDGSVVLLDPDGALLAEHALGPVAGYRVAAKSVAWDPARDELWVNTDLLPRGEGALGHDARILDRAGRERVRVERPEIQFAAFRPDGLGLAAEVDEAGLWLRLLRPDDLEAMPGRGQRFLVDASFDRDADFAQDIQFDAEGRAVVTRWSGLFHVLDPGATSARTLRLPRSADGLFYTGVLHGERLCATLCGGIRVVCAADPPR